MCRQRCGSIGPQRVQFVISALGLATSKGTPPSDYVDNIQSQRDLIAVIAFHPMSRRTIRSDTRQCDKRTRAATRSQNLRSLHRNEEGQAVEGTLAIRFFPRKSVWGVDNDLGVRGKFRRSVGR